MLQIVALIQERKINLIEANPFLISSLIGLYLVASFYGNVQEVTE
jgi:hypothetical protein